MPGSGLADLTSFLVQNDCTKLSSTIKDSCYKVTRMKLIEATRLLDESRVNTYAAQKTIVQLIANINTLIDSMTQDEPNIVEKTVNKVTTAVTEKPK